VHGLRGELQSRDAQCAEMLAVVEDQRRPAPVSDALTRTGSACKYIGTAKLKAISMAVAMSRRASCLGDEYPYWMI